MVHIVLTGKTGLIKPLDYDMPSLQKKKAPISATTFMFGVNICNATHVPLLFSMCNTYIYVYGHIDILMHTSIDKYICIQIKVNLISLIL